MGDIVNLRMARKRSQRAADRQAADENRIRHGRTKAEKHVEREALRKARAAVEAHRRETREGDAET